MWLLLFGLGCSIPTVPVAAAAHPVAAPPASPSATPESAASADPFAPVVPPGGKVKDGVVYDAKGNPLGCEGGGNWCNPNPLKTWVEPTLPKCDTVALLTKYDFAWLEKNYCDLCKAEDERACVLDWPVSDVVSCTYWDELRNGIFAYYGYPFKNPTWRERFKAWYTENPNYAESMLSAESVRNVALLKKMAETHQRCE